MTVYVVTYDLRAPGRDYAPVHNYLKKFAYCKGLESCWVIDSTLTAVQVRDALKLLVDANDKVFVARITREWGSYNYGCADWLNDAARSF